MWCARSGPEFDFEAGGENAQAHKDLVVDMLASMPIRGRRAVGFRQVLVVAGRRGQVLRIGDRRRSRSKQWLYLDVKINGTNCSLARDGGVPRRPPVQVRPLCRYPTKG